MTTLAGLADRCQNALSDAAAGIWSQALIEEFLNEALRDYSRHFPRIKSLAIACVTDDRAYDLPAGFTGMVSVEYPANQEPRLYLKRRLYSDGQFWGQEGYYDVVTRDTEGLYDELWISEKPSTGESISIEYTCTHDLDLDPGDTLTVRVEHEDMLVQYVIWKAWTELESAEMQSPTSGSSILMEQYDQNASQALDKYKRLIEEAQAGARGRSDMVRWEVDRFDRVY